MLGANILHQLQLTGDILLSQYFRGRIRDAIRTKSSKREMCTCTYFLYLPFQTELTERLRLRRGRGDTSEDDEGLPRSPTVDSRNSPVASLLDKAILKVSRFRVSILSQSGETIVVTFLWYLHYNC